LNDLSKKILRVLFCLASLCEGTNGRSYRYNLWSTVDRHIDQSDRGWWRRETPSGVRGISTVVSLMIELISGMEYLNRISRPCDRSFIDTQQEDTKSDCRILREQRELSVKRQLFSIVFVLMFKVISDILQRKAARDKISTSSALDHSTT